MTRPFFPVLLGALVAVSCGSNGSNSENHGGGADAGPVLPDPHLFDCTRTADPARDNPIPVNCATDRSCTTRLVSGHRGAGGQLGVIAPEDTVAAVRANIVLGADFVETDPRPTLDGYLVNLHDSTVDRTTNGSGEAAQMTLAQIQALDLETSQFQGDFSCEHVPTLEQILEAARGKVHVLVDANKTDRVDLLVQAIETTKTLDWAIFDTDSVSKIDEALKLEPKLQTMIRVATAQELSDELAHFAAHPPVLVEIHGGGNPTELVPLIHKAKNRAITDTFGVDLAAGLANDPSKYKAVYAEGIDDVDSDRPDLVLRFLGRYPR